MEDYESFVPQEILQRSSCPNPFSLQVRKEGKDSRWMASWWQSRGRKPGLLFLIFSPPSAISGESGSQCSLEEKKTDKNLRNVTAERD